MKIPFLTRILNKRKSENQNQVSLPKSVILSSGGSIVSPETSMKASSFYSGIIYISTQVAKLPFLIKDANNKVIYNTDVYKLLNLSPNPEIDAMDFRLFMLQSALIYGNGYAEIERDAVGRPKALWPIPPNSVEVRKVEGELVYVIYSGKETVVLPPKDIFHIKNFYTKDGIVGQGLVAYASETLGIALGADRFANSLFANGGLPSGVLEVEGELSYEAVVRLRDSWKQAHGGRKTGGLAVLENGVKFNPISHDPQVLQFLESRKFSILEIARFLRIPPTKLYALEAAKFNNIEQENLSVSTDTLSSWCKRFELQVDIKLLGNSYAGRHSELDLTDLFRGDMDTRATYFTKLMSNGALTPNEIRIKEGLEPYEGGDEYYIATNNFTPVGRMQELLDAQISKLNSEKKVNDIIQNKL